MGQKTSAAIGGEPKEIDRRQHPEERWRTRRGRNMWRDD
jgi:hypothetical protein